MIAVPLVDLLLQPIALGEKFAVGFGQVGHDRGEPGPELLGRQLGAA